MTQRRNRELPVRKGEFFLKNPIFAPFLEFFSIDIQGHAGTGTELYRKNLSGHGGKRNSPVPLATIDSKLDNRADEIP